MWSHGYNGFPYGCCHTDVYLPDTGVSSVFYTGDTRPGTGRCHTVVYLPHTDVLPVFIRDLVARECVCI